MLEPQGLSIRRKRRLCEGQGSILESRTDTQLQTLAWRHARTLQVTLAASILGTVLVASATYPLLDSMISGLGASSDLAIAVVVVPLGGLLSLFTSWAAIWGVLGSGRWLARVTRSLLIAHLTYILSIVLAECLTVLRTGDPSWMEWRDALAVISGFSYAFAGSLFVSMFLIWLLKLFRVRLLFFQDPASYPHPRRKAAQQIPICDRIETVIVAGRVSLLDLFGLITIFAVYIAAWKPIVEWWLPNNSMFGPAFAFIIFLVVIATGGAIGILAVMVPLITAMYERWPQRSQITLQGIHFVVAIAAAATCGFFNRDPEIISLLVMALLTFLANQVLLFCWLRRPSKRFRFRLVRP